MTDKTGNHKIRPPKLAITPSMLVAGKERLEGLTAENHPEADMITDDILCAEIFLAMWDQFWSEVMEVQRRKDTPSNILMLPTAKAKGLIIPH